MGTVIFWYLFVGWCLAFFIVLFDAVDGEEIDGPFEFVLCMVTAPATLALHLTLAFVSWYTGLLSMDSREDDQ